MAKNGELTPKQKEVIYIMAHSANSNAGFHNTGIPRATFNQWLKDPKFRNAYATEYARVQVDKLRQSRSGKK